MLEKFRTYQMALELFKDCQKLRLRGTVRDQFDRAILSIPLNLSEGSAKPTAKDRRRFYHIALGSLREIQTLLDLYGTPDLISKADRLGASLYRLCKRT